MRSGFPERLREAYDAELAGQIELDATAVPPTLDVPAGRWLAAVRTARDTLGCAFLDFLSAVDEEEDGIRLVCHLADWRAGKVDHLLLRTLLPAEQPVVESVTGLFPGAAWHERETAEMFGVTFTADGAAVDLERLLLPAEFEGHPLRKDFVLASRAARPWPGVKEPGESETTPVPTRSRRRARPLGAPAPGWRHGDG